MSKKICLTQKQALYFNVIQKFHKAHGSFPNHNQLVAAVREAGGKAGSGASQMYATLLLKGAFTGGVVLTDSARSLHSGGDITPLDLSKLSFSPRELRRGRAPKAAAKPVNTTALATALLDLLKSSPQFNDIIAQLNG